MRRRTMPPDMQMPSVRTTTARSEKNTEQRASVHTIENHTTQRAKITHTSSRRIQYFTRAGRAITRRDERRARGARARSGLRVSKALERAHPRTTPSSPRRRQPLRARTRPRYGCNSYDATSRARRHASATAAAAARRRRCPSASHRIARPTPTHHHPPNAHVAIRTDMLPLKQLLGHNRSQSAKQVALGVDDDNLRARTRNTVSHR